MSYTPEQPYMYNSSAQNPADMTSINGINSLARFVNNQLGDRVRPDVFYDKVFLETIRMSEDQYVYYRLAEERSIGDKAGKLVLRRRTPLKGHIVPLEEGIPPKSDKYGVMKYELEAKQYGRYMEFTDKVDFAMIDPVINEYTQEYGLVAIETLDLLARQALLNHSSKFYAGGVADLSAIIGKAWGTGANQYDMTPTMTDLRLITLAMKRNLIKPRSNGKFQVIGSPEFFYDMIDDEYVKAYMELNQTTSTMYDNSMLVPMFGMEFYETLEVPTSGFYMDGSTAKMLQIDAASTSSTYKQVTGVAASLNTAGYEAYDLRTKDLWGNVVSDANSGDSVPNYADTSYIPANDHYTATFSTGNIEYKVQHVFVVGAGALVRTGLMGEGQVKTYVKPLGSSGVLDPIDQRQSIGFKINSVAFAVLDPKAVCDYICIPTTVNSLVPVAAAG